MKRPSLLPIGYSPGRWRTTVNGCSSFIVATAVSASGGRYASPSDVQKMRLRISIHVGDVMVEGDDLLGDGVNIAARLEGIAAPGGVSVSRAVHDQVRDRIDVAFDDKGEIVLKNIARRTRQPAVAAR